MQACRRQNDNGFTLIELVITLSLVSIFFAFAVANIPQMVNPAQNGAGSLSSFMKKARARAISNTSAVFVTATDPNNVQGRVAKSCDETPGAVDSKLHLILPDNVGLTDIAWSLCFDSRGFASTDLTIPLEDVYDGEQSIDIFVGGAVRVNS